MRGQTAAIGVFDSGIGGLSVLREIRTLLPYEPLVYLADSRHAPYGPKPDAFILERAHVCCRFLVEQGVKAIVVACNTATAAAAPALRATYDLPIIAMEPAIKPAIAASRNGIIGVLATAGTLKSARFAALLRQYAEQVEVITQPCPGLVESIEQGEHASPVLRQQLRRYLEPLLAQGVDTLILGCTHYPLVKKQIAQIVGDQIQLIDTGAAVARQLKKKLAEQGLLHTGAAPVSEYFLTSGDEQVEDVMAALWPGQVEVASLPPKYR